MDFCLADTPVLLIWIGADLIIRVGELRTLTICVMALVQD